MADNRFTDRALVRDALDASPGTHPRARQPTSVADIVSKEPGSFVSGHRNLPAGGQQRLPTHGHLVTQGAGGGAGHSRVAPRAVDRSRELCADWRASTR